MKTLTCKEALQLLLDQVDFTAGACSLTDMVGQCVPAGVFEQCRAAIAVEAAAIAVDAQPDKAGRATCPCTVPGIEPCSHACSCACSVLSGGCSRCATYGSLEQQQSRARFIAEAVAAKASPSALARQVEALIVERDAALARLEEIENEHGDRDV